MQLFVSIARQNGLLLKATANITAGWSRNERGNGFFGKGSIPHPGDRSIEISINARVRPYGMPERFPAFPKDIELSGDLLWERVPGFGVYAVREGKAGVLIAVEALGEELEKNEDEPVHFDKVVLRRDARAKIVMQVSVVVRPSPPVPVGDIPEWDTQFFQGGLPSLGKRRP